jgi:hypothetical protein
MQLLILFELKLVNSSTRQLVNPSTHQLPPRDLNDLIISAIIGTYKYFSFG